MTDKTLGQVAYEAWRERNMPKHPNHLGQYVTPNEWDHVDRRTRDDMQAAAGAVLRYLGDREWNTPEAVGIPLQVLRARGAVIEAAKAIPEILEYLQEDYPLKGQRWDDAERFRLAVEALEEVE